MYWNSDEINGKFLWDYTELSLLFLFPDFLSILKVRSYTINHSSKECLIKQLIAMKSHSKSQIVVLIYFVPCSVELLFAMFLRHPAFKPDEANQTKIIR